MEGDFDFEQGIAEFDKVNISTDKNEEEDEDYDDDDEEGDDMDGFFDTISSEATDKRDGIDNRLRGAEERNLNLDTFGAVSLGNNNRRRYGGRGRGGRGRGLGRGRGRGGRKVCVSFVLSYECMCST